MPIKGSLGLYTEDKQIISDIMDFSDNWSEQYQKAVERGLVPRYLKAPIFALWEITSMCPQRCVYCYNKSPMKVEELSSKKLFAVADELLDIGMFRLCISGGEPNTRPEYLNLLQYLWSGGVQIGTVISGWGMDKDKIKHIARYTSTVQVSLDGSTAEIHDSIRARKGSYDDAVNSIRLLSEAGKTTLVATSLVKENIDDFPRIYELCNKYGVYELRTQYLAKTGRAKDEDINLASDEDYVALKKYIEDIQKTPGATRVSFADPTMHIKSGLNLGYVSLMRITSEGNVGPSPYLNVFFGNVKEQSLKDICKRLSSGWNNAQVRELFASGKIGVNNGIISDNTQGNLFV